MKFQTVSVWVMGCVGALSLSINVWGVTEKDRIILRERVVALESMPTKWAHDQGMELRQEGVFAGTDVAPVVTEKRVLNVLKDLQADGSFSSVDYMNQSRSQWKALRHLDQVRVLAIGHRCLTGDFVKKHKVQESCLKALDWWLEKKPTNPNWWNNEIYAPQILGSIGLVLGDALTDERRDQIVALTKKIKPGRTGQNLLWLGWNTFLLGLLEGNEGRLESGLGAMSSVLVEAKKGEEGIQPDKSFHQHGAQLYQGNYGRHFVHSGAKWAFVTEGTEFEVPAKRDYLKDYFLDGTRWMCWGPYLDYSVLGRQIAYDGYPQGPDLMYPCMYLRDLGDYRKDELTAFMNSQSETGSENGLVGVKVFPYSDYMVFRAPKYMASLKLSSKRMLVGEECNGDNLKGAYLSDGCLMVYGGPRSYEDIFFVWDWSCIPGVTARRGCVPEYKEWSYKSGGDDFAVVSAVEGAEKSGAAGMVLDHFGLKARKSWFFFPNRIVCLGSGIEEDLTHTESGKYPVVTTVEQHYVQEEKASVYHGKTTERKSSVGKGTEGEASEGISSDGLISKGNLGVEHGGRQYFFPSGTTLILEQGKRVGNPRDIRTANPDRKIEAEVFLLAIDSGKSPQKAGYAYQVIPMAGESMNEAQVDAVWKDISIMKHDDDAHVVKWGELIKAVVFQPCTLDLEGMKFEIEKPCILSNDKLGKWFVTYPGKESVLFKE